MEMAQSTNDGNLGSAKKELHCVMGLTFTCKYAKSYSIINSIQQPLTAASFNTQFQSKANKEIWYDR